MCSQSHNRQNHSKSKHGRSQSYDKIRKDVVNVVVHILLNNAQHTVRNVSIVRKRIISPGFAEVVVIPKKTDNPKHFLRKDAHEIQNSDSVNFEYDTDSVEFECIQFTTSVSESSWGSQNSET